MIANLSFSGIHPVKIGVTGSSTKQLTIPLTESATTRPVAVAYADVTDGVIGQEVTVEVEATKAGLVAIAPLELLVQYFWSHIGSR